MKKNYTRKQITEAIAYWKKQLNESRESDQYEIACIPQIAKYISTVLKYDESTIYVDTNSRISPLLTAKEIDQIRNLNSRNFRTTGFNYLKKNPTDQQIKDYSEANQIDAIIKFDSKIKQIVPNSDNYEWFIFHTGYNNSNSDILVAHKNYVDNLSQKWDIQNIEIKRNASSYLFQPQLKTNIRMSDGTLQIVGLSHAYLDQFSQNTMKLQEMLITAIQNDRNYTKAMGQICNAGYTSQWLEKFLNGRKSALLMKGVMVPNVEDLVKTFYFDGYDMNRQVSIFQIGSGKNARLFKISNIKSNRHLDPLQLFAKSNTFSSAFNTIILDVEVRKMTENSKINVYGKIRFSNKKANIVGSFDPEGTLPN